MAIGNDTESLEELVKSSWTTEAFGCAYWDSPHSPEDHRCEAALKEELHHNGQQWEAPVIRRDKEDIFPSSKTMAERLARALEKRLDSSEKSEDSAPCLSQMVYTKMDEKLDHGYFRKLSAFEAAL